jgi:hypothetical protein
MHARERIVPHISLVCLSLGLVYVALSTLSGQAEHRVSSSAVPLVAALLYAVSLMGLLAAAVVKKDRGSVRMLALGVCGMAPLAVIYPWVCVPDNLGIGYAGYRFFLEWLHKHGPAVNMKVLAGIACVLLASFVPAVYVVLCRVNKPRCRRTTIVILLLIETAAYIPVLVKLDWFLLLFSAVDLTGDPIAASGPLLRLAALFAMALNTVLEFTRPSMEESFI